MAMQVETTGKSVVRAGSLASSKFNWSKDNPEVIDNRSEEEIQRQNKKSLGIKTGIGAGAAALLATAFKDGAAAGVERISTVGNDISHVASGLFSIAFPLVTLEGERANFAGSRGDTVDLFTRMTYTAASLGFNSQALIEPFQMALRSPAYAVATAMNMPHMLFSLFSYTGGRSMGFIAAIKKFMNTDPTKSYRLEQEFESWYQIGNLGSAQISVVPMAGQFIMGWENIIDAFKGDFGSIGERFKEEPVTAFLGTAFNCWAWPFEYVSKFFDTTIRVAEMSENIQGAFSENSGVMKVATGIRKWWHSNVEQKTATGKFLKGAREFAKVESLIGPPIGMVSVVWPAMNKFLRGEFTNPEAQEIGGVIGAVDKVFGVGSFLGHTFYTLSYGLCVRLPQVITSSTFYGARLMNSMKGIDVDEVAENFKKNPNYVPPKGYIDPVQVRTKIFKPLTGLSNYAGKWLDRLEKDIQDQDDWWLIDDPVDEQGNPIEVLDSNGNPIKGRGNTRHIRDFAKVVAQDNVFKPIRERLYSAVVEAEIENKFAKTENDKVIEAGEKPTDAMWAYILKKEQYDTFLEHAKEQYEYFLRTSHGLSEDKIKQMVEEEYTSEGAYAEGASFNYDKPMKIEDWVRKLLDNEIKKASGAAKVSETIRLENISPQIEKLQSEVADLEKNINSLNQGLAGSGISTNSESGDRVLKQSAKLNEAKEQLSQLVEEEKKLNGIISAPSEEEEKVEDKKDDKKKITAGSLFELVTKPKELWEVLKLKTFHITNTVLPFWMRGFVRVVDYGENSEAWWKRNLKAQITGIQEGDLKQACDREFPPIVFLAYQNATKGFSLMHRGISGIFGGGSSGDNNLGILSS